MGKVYNFRVDDSFYEYLRKLGTEKVREILRDYRDGLIKQTATTTLSDQQIGQQVAEHKCVYQAIDPKDKAFVWCETKRVPLTVCESRQSRFKHFNRFCYPEHKLPKGTTKKFSSPEKPFNLTDRDKSKMSEDEWANFTRRMNNGDRGQSGLSGV